MNSPRRQDIQGLRALAVALVVVFHVSAPLLPGGYIGVDVFFVISGFLITGHLWRELCAQGRIRFAEFWARRVRRLLPAALLVLLVCATAALTVMPAALRTQNLSEIALAAVYGLNWLLAANSVDYLAADNAPSLAQHYWSLSVEEQFYLVWPVLIALGVALAARRGGDRARRAALFGVLGVVFTASLAWSVIETARSEPAAYFVTTTRAWEFAAGGIVALLPAVRLGSRSRAALSWGAVATIIGGAFVLDEETAFPGWVALVPVVGTALLLWVGDSGSAWSPQRWARARPVQLLGDTSYSVYLWHWPVILVTTELLGRPPGWIWGIVILGITLVLGVLTARFVEEPVRRAPGPLRRPGASFGIAAAAMAVVLVVTLVPLGSAAAAQREHAAEVDALVADQDGCFGAYAVLNDCADPYSGVLSASAIESPPLAHWDAFDDDPACRSEGKVAHGEQGTCSVEGRPDAPRVLLVGDSHAAQYLAPMLHLARAQGWNLELRSRSVCTGLGVWARDVDDAEVKGEGCVAWSERVRQEVRSSGFDAVIVAARPRLYAGQEQEAASRLREFAETGARIIVLGGVPGTGDGADSTGPPAPECVEEAGGAQDPCAWSPEPWEDYLTLAARDSGAAFVDPREVLCSDDGVCHIVIGGALVYQDNSHLTEDFARTLEPWLARALLPLVTVEDDGA